MHWSSKYVGLEFSQTMRCYDLVRAVLRAEKQINLPDYADISAEDAVGISGALGAPSSATLPWTEVAPSDVRAFDVVVMLRRRSREPGHVGILTDARHVLHIEKVTQSVVVPLSHFSIQPRILGFRRHRCL